MTFGRWLSAQKERTDWIGRLARAAEKDSRFPWSAAPLDIDNRVRQWIRAGASTDSMHALQAALDEWHGRPYSLGDDARARRDAVRDAACDAFRRELEAEEKRKRRNARRRALYAQRKVAASASDRGAAAP